MTLSSQIVDDGVSAFTGVKLQPELEDLIASIRAGKVPNNIVLLIENMDRFSRRNPIAALPTFIDALETGLTIVTLQDEMIHSAERYRDNSMLLIPSLVQMQLAYDESAKKSTRLKASWAGRVATAKDGRRIALSKVPFWIDNRTQQFNDRRPDAERIFSLALDGHGSSAITRMINAEGIPSPRGGTWGRSMVQDVLSSKAAYGCLEITGTEVQDYFLPLIDRTHWTAIRNRASRQRRNPRAATDANLFPRLLVCGGCGGTMEVTTTSAGGRRYKYAACSQRKTHRNSCTAPNWRYDDLEEAFIGKLGGMLQVAKEAPEALKAPSEHDRLVVQIEDGEAQMKRAAALAAGSQDSELSHTYAQVAEGAAQRVRADKDQLARLLDAEAETSLAAEQVADIGADLAEALRLSVDDRPRLKTIIAAIVKEMELQPYDPKDYNVAVIRFRSGGLFNLIVEGPQAERWE